MAERVVDRPGALANGHSLLKEVEELVDTIETDGGAQSVRAIAERVVGTLGARLGLTGGRVYHRDGTDYALSAVFPEGRPRPKVRVSADYPPIRQLMEERFVYMREDDPHLDRELEERLGAREFAAIWVHGEHQDAIVAFDVAPGSSPDAIRHSLSILRYSILHRLRSAWMGGVLREAKRIQESMLPRRVPSYGDYDLAGRLESIEAVGGDFFDFIPITPTVLGLVIADVSGHGLPAALQTRDVYTGLRMGLARDLKIVRTVERLNRIVSRSTLTSRFVSMFYGELERNGLFIYVNAGHNAPFHVDAAGDAVPLVEGGPVLGPVPEASYERGIARLAPGDTLVLYTDGIVETRGERAGGGGTEEFGTDRLLDVVRETLTDSAAATTAAIFQTVDRFDREVQPKDDRTVVVVKRPPSGDD